jgi:hypothetical protein
MLDCRLLDPLLKGKKWFIIYVILSILLFIAGCSVPTSTTNNLAEDDNLTQVEEELGIEIQPLHLSAGGYIVDFRYKAIDPEKANILFNKEIQPYLLHEATGGVLAVPNMAKIGPLRTTSNQPVAGKIYFMLFANAGKYVKSGDKVTVIFGDYRMEHLTVE